MRNQEISKIFQEIAQVLQIRGDNPFRIRAYERAAQNIEGLGEDIEDLARDDRLREVPGVGLDLSEKIKEYLATGKIKHYEDLKKKVPAGLLDLLRIPSVGPKTAKLLFEKLRIKNIDDLAAAIKKNKLEGIFGIKEKTIANILKGMEIVRKGAERMTLAQAVLNAEEFLAPLKALPEVKKISLAGSLRRQKETVRDIDILAVSRQPLKVMRAFVSSGAVKDILSQGQTKASVRTRNDVQVDCRVVEEKSFGAALLYFTGAKNFNIKLRQLAIKRGLKINEYGVFRGRRLIAGRTEEEIFKALGMSYIEPELREDSGEIELAKKFRLPHLLESKDIKGDLHVHSLWSDGNNSIQELAEAAKNLGYRYLAVTDHSQGLEVAGGLSPRELKQKRTEIDSVNKKITGLRVLYGSEANIGSSGRMDYKDEILERFDLVVAAIHTGFQQSREQLTARLVKACQNKYVHIIAHPTGRLWGIRDAYDLDFDRLFNAARDTNTALEINAFPQRLDLNDLHCRRAKEAGVRLAIGTDAHSAEQLPAMKFGVAVARRGWLSPKDVLNSLDADELLKRIKK
jgi:DNA polymerase (family 10)